MQATLTTTIVELHIDDFEKAKSYYSQLGFKVVWQRQPEEKKGYLVMKKDDNTLRFWPGNEYMYQNSYFKNFPKNTKRGYGVEICIMFSENIDEFYEKVKETVNVVVPLRQQPWGVKDFRIEDPFGYFLCITEPFDVLNSENAVS